MTKSAAWRSVFVGAVVLLASAVPAPGQTVSFIARKDFPAGNQPRSAAVADFNGDGVADLATGNAGSDSVSVLLGNGDGTFRLPQVLAAGRVPWSVAAADFNGDRAPDLAVANSGTFNDPANTVSVLLANGDGTFQAPQSFAVGTRPLCVVAGDFNRDGIPDLATANSAGVAVLLGNGDMGARPGRSSRPAATRTTRFQNFLASPSPMPTPGPRSERTARSSARIRGAKTGSLSNPTQVRLCAASP